MDIIAFITDFGNNDWYVASMKGIALGINPRVRLIDITHNIPAGDVNAGAEIVAGGDVLVWGKLRGVVHAGAMGDDSAVVCALWMAPIQLRIGQHIARPPEGGEFKAMHPEMALVRDGNIQTDSWSVGR